MFGKLLIAATLMFWSLGCTRPQYIEKTDSTANGLQSQESLMTQLTGSDLKASIKWTQIPNETEYGSFVMRIYKTDSVDEFPFLEDLSVDPEVTLWMPSMNHGSTPVKISKVGIGTYEVTDVFFIMPGEWQILINIKTEAIESNGAIDIRI